MNCVTPRRSRTRETPPRPGRRPGRAVDKIKEGPMNEAGLAADPFRLAEPFVVSFSGGRTSGYMLRRILDAFAGRMPDGGKVIFCNTGKERPETLDFVERCSL